MNDAVEAQADNEVCPYHALEKDLAALLNSHSMERISDTPDFLLAQHMIESLRQFDQSTRARQAWSSPEMQKSTPIEQENPMAHAVERTSPKGRRD